MTADPIAMARDWVAGDPDPATRAELQALIDAEDRDELAERMAGGLRFGTAGMRGPVGAGSNRMNRAVVIRATRGLADVLLSRHGGPLPTPVVVGFDARPSSRTFAGDTIGVLVAAGIRVRYFPEPVPTPMVAFAAKALEAPAAVMVTASHNPAGDNGYKVYDANAVQIVPPVDAEIAAAIERVGRAADVPRQEGALEGTSPLASPVPADLADAYWQEVAAVRPRVVADRGLRIVYTPLHGVGWKVLDAVMRRGGFDGVLVVPEQRHPDGRFPTVPFPNPEEPGALDLALELARRTSADLVLANDPDADRLAAAIPVEGGWRPLTGDQVGALLADHLLRHWSAPERPIVINTIVSSPMLRSLCEGYGARFEQTLTGFKWICNAALDLEAAGEGRFCFGYEEALGYTVGGAVRDKDGISAALVFADLVASLRDRGRSVPDRLGELYRRHGLWVSLLRSVTRTGAAGRAEIDAGVRTLAADPPDALAGMAVIGVTDFRRGAEGRPRWLPASPLIVVDLDGGGRVSVRPSGTEPRLKVYVHLPGVAGDRLDAAERPLRTAAERVAAEVVARLGS
ncbi:MAG TPA: phospho-sugar mutase [Actinomycetota bacterium]